MNFRHDTYTRGEHYWIRFRNGIHEVVKAKYVDYDEFYIEAVFTGHYDKCIEYLKHLLEENYEYDNGL